MATKKIVKKEEKIDKAEKTEKVEKAEKAEKIDKEIVLEKRQYISAVGKRKTAIARVRIYPCEKPSKSIIINDKKLEEYFVLSRSVEVVKSPFSAVGQDGKFDVTVKVFGGGISAQADAVRLGISRALVKFDETFRKALKDRKYLTRDPRVVERKKPGLKKARKSPQWAKR
jgi:small subunit ribosomal protein S9